MKRWTASILTIFLVFTIAFTGCAKKAVSSTSSSNEKVTLEFFQQKKEVVDTFSKIITKFQAKYPNITINQVNSPDAQNVLLTRISTNDVPDMLTTLPAKQMYKTMMDEGLFLDITKESFLKNINPTVISLTKEKGKNYALPMATTTYGIYYNKDIFKANNITAPTTIDQLYADCDKLKAAGITPFEFYDKDATAMAQQAERTIGVMNNAISDKFSAATSSNTSAIEPYFKTLGEMIVKLRSYGQSGSLGYDTTAVTSDFVSGKCAMDISGTWLLSDINKINPKMNVELIPIPNAMGSTTNLPIDIDPAVSISATCKHPTQAKLFLEFLSTNEADNIYVQSDASPTAVKNVTSSVTAFQKVETQLNSGKMFLTPSAFWPTSLRGDWAVKLQQLVLDKNVDKFVKDSAALVVKDYSKK